MNGTVSIRQAETGDADALRSFMVSLVEERLPVIFRRPEAPSLEEERAFIERLGQSARSVLFLAHSELSVVGVLDAHGRTKPQQAHVASFGISVAREYRHRGVGRALLAALFGWAPRRGIRRLELEVFSNNPDAVRFYERAGFVHEGRRREAVEIDGGFCDILLMAQLISAG